MGFKMKGFNPGKGTGMGSAFTNNSAFLKPKRRSNKIASDDIREAGGLSEDESSSMIEYKEQPKYKTVRKKNILGKEVNKKVKKKSKKKKFLSKKETIELDTQKKAESKRKYHEEGSRAWSKIKIDDV